MLGMPTPLAISLVLSYLAMALVVAAAICSRRIHVPRVQVLLWGGLGLGALSITTRTVYFALA